MKIKTKLLISFFTIALLTGILSAVLLINLIKPLQELSKEFKSSAIIIENILTKGAFIFLLAVVLDFILALGFGYFISLSISRRLQEINKSATEFARGNENVKIALSGKDEIGELARALNGMVENIKKSHLELRDAKNVLEVKVKARTKELEDLALGLEKRVEERTKKLQGKIKELEKFQRLTVGRELKMLELKEELKRTKEELEKFKGQKI